MKTLIATLIILCTSNIALASQNSENKNYCSEDDSELGCNRDKFKLPIMESLPLLPDNMPIKLKVIPYINREEQSD